MQHFYKITKISPFVSTANIGDQIIADHCDQVFSELFGAYMGVTVPSRERISRAGACAILTSDCSFVCGTNLLTSDIRKNKPWNINGNTMLQIALSGLSKRKWFDLKLIGQTVQRIHIVLMGVGWFDYQAEPTPYTKKVLRKVLDGQYLHSVRDSYTEKRLKQMGIHNVVNTACPTMWNLTEEFCQTIPTVKKDSVVATVTDYRRNPERDKKLLDILLSNYQNVFLWMQSFEDIQYLSDMGYDGKVAIIPPALHAYDDFLAHHDVDYIGTRLHGGIRALNHQKRACIICIDNRAAEISADTALPTVKEDALDSGLLQWIYGEAPTAIRLPMDNINRWKQQFMQNRD